MSLFHGHHGTKMGAGEPSNAALDRGTCSSPQRTALIEPHGTQRALASQTRREKRAATSVVFVFQRITKTGDQLATKYQRVAQSCANVR